MKWAAAKTWLSFVTATRNSLPPDTPPSFEQHRVDHRPREVRGGTGVQCVGVVAQLAVQVGDGGATRRGPDAAGVAHGAGAPLNRGCRVAPELARDVRVGRRGEQGEVRLHHHVSPVEAVVLRAPQGRHTELERRVEVGSVLARNGIPVARQSHDVTQVDSRRPGYVLLGRAAQLPGRSESDGDRKSTRLNSSHSQISYAVFCLKKKKNVLMYLFSDTI